VPQVDNDVGRGWVDDGATIDDVLALGLDARCLRV
jgi:hypothetical protein